MSVTTTAHPLDLVRRSFLRHTSILERCRAEYQRRGEIDEALQMERALGHLGEATRQLELLIRKTGGRVAS